MISNSTYFCHVWLAIPINSNWPPYEIFEPDRDGIQPDSGGNTVLRVKHQPDMNLTKNVSLCVGEPDKCLACILPKFGRTGHQHERDKSRKYHAWSGLKTNLPENEPDKPAWLTTLQQSKDLVFRNINKATLKLQWHHSSAKYSFFLEDTLYYCTHHRYTQLSIELGKACRELQFTVNKEPFEKRFVKLITGKISTLHKGNISPIQLRIREPNFWS